MEAFIFKIAGVESSLERSVTLTDALPPPLTNTNMKREKVVAWTQPQC